MTLSQKEQLNHSFVKVFNSILSWEEQSFKKMGVSAITLRELHVVEAVFRLAKDGKNKMSNIAAYLSITPGSLTTSVNCLVKKGYLKREPDPSDRRVVKILPTDKAKEVNELHDKFHMDMIDALLGTLTPGSAEVLLDALDKTGELFSIGEARR